MSDYALEFIKKLESLYHEQIRKAIDLEIRLSIITKENDKHKEQYELSQKEVEKQNEIMKQATVSIESLTLDNKSLDGRTKELNEIIIKLTDEKNKISDENNSKSARIANLEHEMQRMQTELQKTYDELIDIKSKFELNQKDLNDKMLLLESINNPSKKPIKTKKESSSEDNTF